MATSLRRRAVLCTWTPEGGDRGEPARPIELRGVSAALLERAFIVRSEDASAWRRVGPTLHVYLRASVRPQTSERYELFFNGYRLDELSKRFDAGCRELSGCQWACWVAEFGCDGWRDEAIDAAVRGVLAWHNAEIGRLVKVTAKSLRGRTA